MKKTLSAIVMLCFLLVQRTNAQVTFSPLIFTAIDEVTVTVDVTGTPLAGESSAYIWIFSNPDATDEEAATTRPKKDGVTNGGWGNSAEAAKMTAAGANKWSFKFKGNELFGLPPSQLVSFGFLVKAKDGSKQTPDYKPFKFDPLVFVPTKMRVFPNKVGVADVIGLNFDQSLTKVTDEARMTPVSVTIILEGAAGVLGTKEIALKKEAATIWAAYFIPTYTFGVTETQLAGGKFRYRFNGTIPAANGAVLNITTEEVTVPFITLK